MDKLKQFHRSQHSINRSSEREISVEMMKDVINYPDELKKQHVESKHGGQVYKFTKTVADKVLIVIAEIKKTECWLITAFYKW